VFSKTGQFTLLNQKKRLTNLKIIIFFFWSKVVRIKDALQKLFLKERETFTSCKPEVAEVFQPSTLEVKPNPILPSSPNDGRLRGILKKSAPNNVVTLANQYSQDKTRLTIFNEMI
jgi:hypothetical protein